MKINARWEVSYVYSWATFDLEDMNIQSEEEWDSLTKDEQKEKIQEAIDDKCDAPSLLLDEYKIIK